MLEIKSAGFKITATTFLLLLTLLHNGFADAKKYDEEDAKAYLQKLNADFQVRTTESVVASWDCESNITDETMQHQLDVAAKLANYTKEVWKETVKYPWKTFKSADLRRQFQKYTILGTAILSAKKYEKYNKIVSSMQSIYGKAKICSYSNRTDCSLQLEPDITEIFVKSRDPNELRYYWQEWRNAAGKPVREMFKEYVDLSNEAAVLNNFTDTSEFWLRDYEAKDFKKQVEDLWEQVKPLYLQLHAYVRKRLREQYGEEHVSKTGPIPSHLLGNVWAQSWANVRDFTIPYPGKKSVDVTENMVKQGYTPLRMFKLAEEFFTSLDLSPMPETFWNNSILEKPTDGRDLICHASAWDFYDGKDFRIKQCTRIDMEDLSTVHHEMGHIQYYLQYKNQPIVYKEGANPGFHEAIGDVMALSVSTPKHLKKIGLLNDTDDDAEADINQLFTMALDKIAFLPFGYLMDQWRWSVFEGTTTDKEYNCKWWQLREAYQGLSPSVERSEADFDPGAKYHIIANVPYIRYFVSFIIQFQFHRSLCIAAKEFDPENPSLKPLHQCDIYRSKEAGALLKKMLQMGSSKPWPDAMEVLTGQKKMDASALLDYFALLKTWLENENGRTGEYIGWETTQQACHYPVEESVGTSTSVSSKSEGMEDNVGISYAELVRQDDNAFGVSDFTEETKPSHHSLLHRHKKSEMQGNTFSATKRAYELPKCRGNYLRERPTINEKLLDLSELKILQKKLTEVNQQHEQPLQPQYKAQSENSIQLNKKNYREPFEVRSKYNGIERAKILNAILKDLHNLKPKQENVGRQFKVSFSCSSSTGSLKVKRKIKNKTGNKPEGYGEVKVASKVPIKGEDKSWLKPKQQKMLHQSILSSQALLPQKTVSSQKLLISQPLLPSQVSPSQQLPLSQLPAFQRLLPPQPVLPPQGLLPPQPIPALPHEEVLGMSNSLPENTDLKYKKEELPLTKNINSGCVLESSKMLCDKECAKDESNNNELLMKAEMAMKGAEQIIKNFTESNEEKSHKLLVPIRPGQIVKNINHFESFDTSSDFKPRPKLPRNVSRHNPRRSTQTKNAKIYLNANILKDFESHRKDETDGFPVKELDLIDIISVGDSAVSSQSDNRLTFGQSRKARQNQRDEHATIIGKLTFDENYQRGKECVKKSYKEFHYNVRTPVVYNSVVISSGGKQDKTDDSRDSFTGLTLKNNKANCNEFVRLRRDSEDMANNCKNALSKSVRMKNINIKNLHQYFGLTVTFSLRITIR